MESNSTVLARYSPSSLRQIFGITRGGKVGTSALDFVFNHYASQNAAIRERAQRYKLSVAQSTRHVGLRLNLYYEYVEDFLNGFHYSSRAPLRLAVICGGDLLEKISEDDLIKGGISPARAGRYLREARQLQAEADLMRASNDLDFRPPHPGWKCTPSRAAAFLAHIDLFSKVYSMRWGEDRDYDTLCDHLRDDLICAPRYIDTGTAYGGAMAAALDQWEDEIVAHLAPHSAIINVRPVNTPAFNGEVIAFPGPRR